MSVSIFKKMTTILNYIFTHSIGLGLVLVFFILLSILLFNMHKNKSKIINISISILYIGVLVFTYVKFNSYVVDSIKEFFKGIVNYMYFPSTMSYFVMVLFATIIIIFTLNSNMKNIKKIFNLIVFTFIEINYIVFMYLAISKNIELGNISLLYENKVILYLVQISNFLMIIYILVTLFYYLYIFFQNKFDRA